MKEELVRSANMVAFNLKKKSPDILFVVGAVGVVASTIWACKQTRKVEPTLKNLRSDLDDIQVLKEHEENYDCRKDLTKAYFEAGKDFVKLYSGPVIIEVLSIGMMFSGKQEYKRRNANLMAAYLTLDSTHNFLKKNIVEKYGEQELKDLQMGIKREVIEKTEILKNGKSKVVKEEVVTSSYDPNQYSMYAKIFDESCREWSKDPEYNKSFIIQTQKEMQRKLECEGHLFLNDVYTALGFPKTKAGQVVGWLYEEDQNPTVDFNLWDITKPRNNDFINGYECNIILDFNCKPIWEDFCFNQG